MSDLVGSSMKIQILISYILFIKGNGPCSGDSGGGLYLPVMSNGEVRWQLRGIISLSLLNKTTNSCDLTQYTVFTDIAQFRYWIMKIVQDKSFSPHQNYN